MSLTTLWLKSISLFYWLKLTFANLCKVWTLRASCWIAAMSHSTSDVLTVYWQGEPAKSIQKFKNTQSGSIGSRLAILEGSPRLQQVAMCKWRLWVILPTAAVLSSSAGCAFSATGIVPLCLSSYQTHCPLLMPGIPLEPNISNASFFP